ncbi:hypothetical protein [Metallosphaera hakonensis]|uniref:hypothetical protein n=1 Tax=Metallosphaera hakonensis TaxID=79601 RepID=UPI0011B260CF|nr:hypothetical protein [Metallosphaera hakonensis]QIJ32925.1 hypothetical protein DFR87_13110 [Metallosphaera hakonensis JCM 8857 = DSM 7519]
MIRHCLAPVDFTSLGSLVKYDLQISCLGAGVHIADNTVIEDLMDWVSVSVMDSLLGREHRRKW